MDGNRNEHATPMDGVVEPLGALAVSLLPPMRPPGAPSHDEAMTVLELRSQAVHRRRTGWRKTNTVIAAVRMMEMMKGARGFHP